MYRQNISTKKQQKYLKFNREGSFFRVVESGQSFVRYKRNAFLSALLHIYNVQLSIVTNRLSIDIYAIKETAILSNLSNISVAFRGWRAARKTRWVVA